MRILTLSPEFPPRVGGIATHVAQLCHALAIAGHEVMVMAPDPHDTVTVHSRASSYRYVRFSPPINIKPVYDYFLERELRRRIAQAAPQVLHVHGLRPLAAALACDRPVVFTNHTSGFLMKAARGGASLRRTMRLVNQSAYLLAPSEELVTAAQKSGYTGPCEYIPNGVWIERFTPGDATVWRTAHGLSADEIMLLVPRRLVEKNGVRVAADAARYLTDIKCRFVFAGDGPERDTIVKIFTAHNLMSRLLMLGAVENDKMADVYRAADICLLPSLYEATSIAGLEAMACGKPLIASRVGGLPSIINDHQSGLLVPPMDPYALAEAIRYLALASTLRRQWGAAARERVEKEFGWPAIASRTANVLASVARHA